ncbi:hypothetical protein N431DRAFT_434981 [Stipitochalara longipes BDJ]|nr:hypothetical protein N431DRAFT_434981 [Stipitochalara longipes BDJ]
MSSYAPLPQTPTSKYAFDFDDPEEPLHNIPSNLDLALNGGTNRTFLSPNVSKTGDTLLDPEAFRRLSISTISSMGRARSVSPYPYPTRHSPATWKQSIKNFWHQNQGLFYVAFSQLFGASMNVAARLLELEGDGMRPIQLLFVRQGLTTILCTVYMWWAHVPDFPLGVKGLRKLLVARACTGFFGIYGMYYSLQYLPVADAVVITFLAPSVASYGCYLFLREPFSKSAQYASLISLLGVVLIARPTSFFTHSDSIPSLPTNVTTTTEAAYDSSFPVPTSAQRLSAVAVAMVGVLGSAGALTSIRWIGNQAHPLVSVNYFSILCTLVSGLVLSLSKPLHISDSLTFVLPNGPRQWFLILFLGTCGFVMQYLLTKGLVVGGRGNGVRATNMIYTNMLFALALDKVVFGQSPGWWSLGGSGLILGSAVFVAVKKGQAGETSARGRGRDEEAGGVGGEEEMAMLSGEVEFGDEVEGEEQEGGVDREAELGVGAGVEVGV